MDQRRKKVWKIPLVILGIIVAVVLLSLLQYLWYNRSHYSRYTFAWNGEGKLLLKGGSEYKESIPVKLNGTYFDHGMFYPDKDGLYVEAACGEDLFFDGYYYVGNMRDYLPEFVDDDDDGSNIRWGEYGSRLVYADYQRDGSFSFVFYLKDVSAIVKDGESGQKGLFIVTEPDSVTAEEVIQKAIRESERVNHKYKWKQTDPVWEDYLIKQ